jgi:hypothetical protein
VRTTVTLDDDLAQALRQLAYERRQPLRRVVNDAIRRGLQESSASSGRDAPFEQQTDGASFRPGVDPLNLDRLVDDTESGGRPDVMSLLTEMRAEGGDATEQDEAWARGVLGL